MAVLPYLQVDSRMGLEALIQVAERMLSEAIEEYLDQRTRQGKKHRTVEADRSVLSRLLAHVGNVQTRHLRAEHVEAFFLGKGNVIGLTDSVSQPASYNKLRERTIGFLNWAHDRRYTKAYGISPGSNGEGRPGDFLFFVPRKKVLEKDKLFLTAEQMLHCLDVAGERHPRDRMMLSLAIGTGLRSVDLIRMQWGMLDLDEGWLYTDIEKTGVRDRKPLPVELQEDLRAWYKYVRAEHGTVRPEWYVIPAKNPVAIETGPDGKGVVVPQKAKLRPERMMRNPQHVVREILIKAGVYMKGNALHAFRRSAADLYYKQVKEDGHGDDALVETASFLNHKDTKTTAIYLNKDRVRDARDTRLRGQKFLTRGVDQTGDSNVIPLKRVEGQ